jgi:hypothetical protein
MSEMTLCGELECSCCIRIKLSNGFTCFGVAKKPKKRGDIIIFCMSRHGEENHSYHYTPFEAAAIATGLSGALMHFLTKKKKEVG